MKKSVVLFFAISLFLVVSANAQNLAKTFTNSGWFDGIKMTSKESGDYGGMSVYLTESDGKMYALVTVSEGMPLDPVLVEANVTGKGMRTVDFKYSSPSYGRELKLKGTILANGLRLGGYADKPELLPRKCSPTYSDITVDKKSGDYGGMEVFLTDNAGAWFALVTVAEGVLMRPVLVKAEVTGKDYDKITFTLPNENGGRKFTGTLSSKAGTLTLHEGGTRTVLKAKCYK